MKVSLILAISTFFIVGDTQAGQWECIGRMKVDNATQATQVKILVLDKPLTLQAYEVPSAQGASMLFVVSGRADLTSKGREIFTSTDPKVRFSFMINTVIRKASDDPNKQDARDAVYFDFDKYSHRTGRDEKRFATTLPGQSLTCAPFGAIPR